MQSIVRRKRINHPFDLHDESKAQLGRLLRVVVSPVLILWLTACSQGPELKQSSPSITSIEFLPEQIGAPTKEKPWIAHVKSVDLNQDGLIDVIACEARENSVIWIRQTKPGFFEEIVLATDMRAPVHCEPVDFDQDGDLDILVACMSFVFPNNDKIGAVIILENRGNDEFGKRVVLEHTDRVTDVRAADFDGDGLLDLAVGQFGFDQGQIRWMRQTKPWEFESEILLLLSGAINVCVADFNSDGHPDIAALISQQWEEIHLFENEGRGAFSRSVIWGSTNEEFASSGMSVADINQDDRPDLLFSNGDGFGPVPVPGPRPWHGLQWLENLPNGSFAYHRIADLPGAFSPICADLDKDGDNDVLAVSAFNNWADPNAESFVWFENNGAQDFTRRLIAGSPTHLVSVSLFDFDQSGMPRFITGGFNIYPPYDRLSRVLLWQTPQS